MGARNRQRTDRVSLREVGVITENLTEKEKLGRVDIAYRTNAGKHIIVELKRARRLCKLLELQGQGQTYVDKLRKILLNQGDNSPDIEVVFVLGRPIQEQADNPERLKPRWRQYLRVAG